jgi:hypothetical protein
MRKVILGVAFALALGLGAARAEATTACYSWSCNELTHVCNFNASCSSWSGSLWRFSWDFGDGSSALTGSAATSHTYGNTPYPDVKLTVIPLSDNPADRTCGIVVFNNVGPALPAYGSCP